jgi:hypothetical protein
VRSAAIWLCALLLVAGCSAAAPTLAPTATPLSEVAAHVKATTDHLDALATEAGSGSDAVVLTDMKAMLETLLVEVQWLKAHGDPTSVRQEQYAGDITTAITALKTAIAKPTSASNSAAASAVLAVRASGSNIVDSGS